MVVFVSGIVSGLARRRSANILRALAVGRPISLAFSLLMGVSGGVIGELASSRSVLETGLHYNERLGLAIGLASGGIFVFCYLLGYFRLPLYPISALSSIRDHDRSHTGSRMHATSGKVP